MAYQLIKGYRKKDAFITDIIDQYDFYIMPVVNPDGEFGDECVASYNDNADTIPLRFRLDDHREPTLAQEPPIAPWCHMSRH
jgi:hypothetical protein